MVLTGNYTRMRVDNYTKEMLDSRDLKAFRKKPLSDFFKLMDCENPEDALDLMIEDYAACPYRPWSINGPKPLQNATREDVKDFKFCRYYYVIFCHYNKAWEIIIIMTSYVLFLAVLELNLIFLINIQPLSRL